MSFLAKAKKPAAKPPMLTIVGSPGVGKTTLGALFPAPVFIQTEDGAAVFENWEDEAQPTLIPRLPKAKRGDTGSLERSTRQSLIEIMDELIQEDHGFKTLVVDSITTLNVLFEHEICERDNVGAVGDAAGGFHKGYGEIGSWHADFVYKCEQLRAIKKMAIVFLAHTGIKKIRNRPDAAADYSVFSMEMPNDSMSIYVSQCDAVLYLKKDELVMGSETNRKGQTTKYGRITQTGERTLITTSDGQIGYINAKNRYGMPVEIPVTHGENPIIPYVKFFNSNQGEQA